MFDSQNDQKLVLKFQLMRKRKEITVSLRNSPISLEKISLPDPDDEDRVYTVLLCSFKHS